MDAAGICSSMLGDLPSAFSNVSAVLFNNNLPVIPGEWQSGKTQSSFYDITPTESCVADVFQKVKAAAFIAFNESFFDIIGADARVERIQEFPNGGTHESPIWLPDSNEFLYSTVSEVGKMYAIEIDSHDVRTINLNPSLSNVDGGTSHRGVVYVATQGGPVRGIHRVNPTSGATEVVVNNYYGRHFNSPNDIVFDAADNMWFTDPTYGQDSRWPGVQASELPQSIYRLDARSKALQAVSTAIISKPNGIALSPDERTLYVCDSLASNNDLSAQRAVWAFDVRPNGAGLDAPRLVHQLEGGWPDGIKVSESGLLMVAAAGGVDVVDPATGVRVGKINVAGDEIVNLAAATGKGAWLLTGQSGIYKVTMKEAGKEL